MLRVPSDLRVPGGAGQGAGPGAGPAREQRWDSEHMERRKEGRKQGGGEEGKGWAAPASSYGETAARGRVSIRAPAHPGAHERYLAESGRSCVRPR